MIEKEYLKKFSLYEINYNSLIDTINDENNLKMFCKVLKIYKEDFNKTLNLYFKEEIEKN